MTKIILVFRLNLSEIEYFSKNDFEIYSQVN